MKRISILTFLTILLSLIRAFGEVNLPNIFSDGMVLQQNSDVAIWGKAQKNSNIKIKPSWENRSYIIHSDENGEWKTSISTPRAGGPYQIIIDDGTEVVLKDVMIGEVWFCSGQSNMEMTMEGRYNEPVNGAQEEIVMSNNPMIRMFTVEKKMTTQPAYDCDGTWKRAVSSNVAEFSAVGYYFAKILQKKLNVPVGLIAASVGGSRIEAWMSADSFAPFKRAGSVDSRNASILYNGMINPVLGYSIRGCLWYQGEANVRIPHLYPDLFEAFVSDMRSKWNIGTFPVYFAQIAPFSYGTSNEINSAYMREAQLKCRDMVPNTEMVVLLDIGNKYTIHPAEKEKVGARFAFIALAKTYEKTGFEYIGPVYKSMSIKGDKVTLFFDHASRGFAPFTGCDTGFEIAGFDKKFHPAQVVRRKNSSLVLASDEVPYPVAARYAFKDYVVGTLFNTFGLPASSFRTDNW